MRAPLNLQLRHFVWPVGGVALVLCLILAAQAGPARTPVQATPNILGREIPRFILLEPLRINRQAPGLTNRDMMDRMEGQMLPGQFVPVMEDTKGFYYQSARGFQSVGHTSSQPAGLYVSKTRAQTIVAYTGDARVPGAELNMDIQRLSGADMAKLKVGTVAR